MFGQARGGRGGRKVHEEVFRRPLILFSRGINEARALLACYECREEHREKERRPPSSESCRNLFFSYFPQTLIPQRAHANTPPSIHHTLLFTHTHHLSQPKPQRPSATHNQTTFDNFRGTPSDNVCEEV